MDSGGKFSVSYCSKGILPACLRVFYVMPISFNK